MTNGVGVGSGVGVGFGGCAVGAGAVVKNGCCVGGGVGRAVGGGVGLGVGGGVGRGVGVGVGGEGTRNGEDAVAPLFATGCWVVSSKSDAEGKWLSPVVVSLGTVAVTVPEQEAVATVADPTGSVRSGLSQSKSTSTVSVGDTAHGPLSVVFQVYV
jgi:hypothetical protein